MLFLLRNIRRKLLSQDNKVASYVLYALGEVLLVVVGILIAVQIDNWNEDRKTKQSVTNHLLVLSQNLMEDQIQLALLGRNMTDSKNAADSLMLQMMKLAPVNGETTKYLVKMLLEFQFKPNKNALETITQAGEIPYLSPALQKAILDYYSLIESAQEREQISNNQIQGKYEVYINNQYASIFQKSNRWEFFTDIYKNDPRAGTPFDQERFHADKKMEALIVSRMYQTTVLNDLYFQLAKSCDALLAQIEQELNNE